MTRATISDLIRRYADTFNGDEEAAKSLGISAATLSLAIRGEARIGPVLLEFLGVRRVDMYEVDRLPSALMTAIADLGIPKSVEYDDARRSAERSAKEDPGDWKSVPVRGTDGAVQRVRLNEPVGQATARARVSTRHRVRARRKLQADNAPRTAATDLGRRKRLNLTQIRALVDAGRPLSHEETRSAFRTLKTLNHPKSRATDATKAEALALYQQLAGKEYVPTLGKRTQKRPQDISPLAIKRAKGRVRQMVEDSGLVVITADTPALLAAADELVLDGYAQAISDRIERVKGGPVAAGAATRRERRVLKITGDQRI
jgi:hypothetical protein